MANAFHLKYTELNRSGIRGDFSSRMHPISPALDDCESNSRSSVTSTATLRRDAALQRAPPCDGAPGVPEAGSPAAGVPGRLTGAW
jgi:hypothetical protein